MDFDNRKVYGDTSIADGLVLVAITIVILIKGGQLDVYVIEDVISIIVIVVVLGEQQTKAAGADTIQCPH